MKITLQNFRQASSFELELPDSGLVLLKGETGKGKTTILDAIYDAITGMADDVIPWDGSLPVQVVLEMPAMTITRTHKPETLSVGLPDGQVFTGESAQFKIFEVLGMASHIEFTASSYIRQRMEGSLLSLKPAEQLRFIQRLAFGEDDPEKYKEKISHQIGQRTTDRDKLIYQLKTDHDAYEREKARVEQMAQSIAPAPKASMTDAEYHEIRNQHDTLVNQRQRNDKRSVELGNLLKHPGHSARKRFKADREALLKENQSLEHRLENSALDAAEMPMPWTELSSEEQQKAIGNLLEKLTYLKWRADVTNFTTEMKERFQDFGGTGAVAFLQTKMNVNQVALAMARQHLSSVRTTIAQYSVVATAQPCPSCNTPLTVQGGKIVCADCPTDVSPEVVLNLAKTKETSLVKEQDELLEQQLAIKIALNLAEKLADAKMADPLPTIKTNEEIEAKRAELNAYRDQQIKLISDRSNVFKEIDKIKSLIAEHEQRITTIEKNAKDADEAGIPTEEQIETERNQIAQQNEEITRQNTELSERIRFYEAYSKQMSIYKAEADRLKQMQADLYALSLTVLEANQRTNTAALRLAASMRLKECSDAAAISATEMIINSINQYATNHINGLFPNGGTAIRLLSGMKIKTGDERSKLSLEVIHKGVVVGRTIRPLSGGEKDRIKVAFQLALAEIYNAPLLMFDEPFAGIDVENTMDICLGLLKQFSQGKLVIMAQHAAPAEPFDLIVDV